MLDEVSEVGHLSNRGKDNTGSFLLLILLIISLLLVLNVDCHDDEMRLNWLEVVKSCFVRMNF